MDDDGKLDDMRCRSTTSTGTIKYRVMHDRSRSTSTIECLWDGEGDGGSSHDKCTITRDRILFQERGIRLKTCEMVSGTLS